jgi:hypothetical protein
MTTTHRVCKDMGMRINYSILPTLALLTFPVCLYAQTAPAETTETLKYYQVELIIFRNLDQSGNTPEIPRLPEPELTEQLDTELARVVQAPENTATARDTDMQVNAVKRVKINPDNQLLAGTVRSIQQLKAYELLAYVSWGQTAPEVALASPVTLAELGVSDTLLNGEIELHQRRYLHLELDLALANATSAALGENLFAPTIRDSRRIRLEKLQYFDQPEFGVIAVVSRIKDEPSD